MKSRTRWLLVLAAGVVLSPALLHIAGCAGPAHRNEAASQKRLAAIRDLGTPGKSEEELAAALEAYPESVLPRSTLFSRVDGVPFVGVSLSGGGSRAGAFGLAVLHELQEVGLLAKLTAMTSVSGGGLAAGLYATRGPQIDWEVAHRDVGQNFINKWVLKQINPINLTKVIFTAENRTDLMAEVFNDLLFKNATFDSLGPLEPGRPVWIPTATETSRKGRRFLFTEDTFIRIGSDFGKFEIARAVMASAAFPAVFNTMTLQRFEGQEGSPAQFIHLIDGGPSDNLGITTLGELASSQLLLNGPKRGPADSCLMIVIDSYAPGTEDSRVSEYDTRGAFGRLIDMNFLDAFDSLLNRRRESLLYSVGLLRGNDVPAGGSGLIGIGSPISAKGSSVGDGAAKTYGFVKTVNFGRFLSEGGFESANVAPGKPGEVGSNQVQCLVWHIALDTVDNVPPYKPSGKGVSYFEHREQINQSIPQSVFRYELRQLVTSIPTNFKLVGAHGCSSEQIQRAIRLAARIVVRENIGARQRVCEHFENAQSRMRQSVAKDTSFLETCAGSPPDPAGPADLGFRIARDRQTNVLRCEPL